MGLQCEGLRMGFGLAGNAGLPQEDPRQEQTDYGSGEG